MRDSIDINCDMGESYGNWRLGNDPEMLSSITTANLACGFHASDPVTMVRSVEAAIGKGVRVGAHPGLPDLVGFGRRVMDISAEDAYAYVMYQGGALSAILASRGHRLSHMKPHGALYLMLNDREDLADAVLAATEDLMADPVLYWPAGSEDGALMETAARRGTRVIPEFYPDLSYSREGRLLIERDKQAVAESRTTVRVKRLLTEGTVETKDGTAVELAVESICLHGDTPNAVEIAVELNRLLRDLGIRPASPLGERGEAGVA